MEKKIDKIEEMGKILWIYAKYQFLTKLLLSALIFPASSWVVKMLLRSKGRVNISSGDFLGFVLSVQGAGLLLLGLLLLTLLVGIDINAFIIISALISEGYSDMKFKHIMLVVIRSLKSFLKPSGLLLMIYIAVIIPIVGVGFTITPMADFEIPNFIKDVIFKNRLYSILYYLLIIALSMVSILYVFVFHYILLLDFEIWEGLKNAGRLMRKHWRSFLVDFALYFLLRAVVVFLVIVSIFVLLAISSIRMSNNIGLFRLLTILGMLFVSEIISFMLFMAVPFAANRLTLLFYRYNLNDGNPVELDSKIISGISEKGGFRKNGFHTIRIIILSATVLISFNLFTAIFSTVNFNEVFNINRNIDIIAHRGGGDLAAENSIAGLEAAIGAGAQWSEIDVQRTKDGKYIINHDSTFKRVAGISLKSSDLTLDEIKNLRIRDLFDRSRPSRKVATIEEFLDSAKNRIGLLIELKGRTADKKMADDIIAMVKERNMLGETAIISANYSLIKYIEENHPEVDTGFLYFFSLGETAKLEGDILIMEEREATPEKVEQIRRTGKKAFVWTVNTEESIDKFVKSDVDGIITDHVLRVKNGIVRRDNRSDYDIIIDSILGD